MIAILVHPAIMRAKQPFDPILFLIKLIFSKLLARIVESCLHPSSPNVELQSLQGYYN